MSNFPPEPARSEHRERTGGVDIPLTALCLRGVHSEQGGGALIREDR